MGITFFRVVPRTATSTNRAGPFAVRSTLLYN